MVSNTACSVVGCNNSRKNATNVGVFRLPSIVTTGKRSGTKDQEAEESSIVNEVIKTISNRFIIFFTRRF